MAAQKPRIAVLVSGRGSNLQALMDAARDATFPGEIALVLSNKDDAYGLTRARDAGIATEIVRHRDFPTRETFDAALDERLRAHNIEFVCLAGFMRILTPEFVAKWEGRMVNIHPSLLPEFKGLDTHARALAAGVAEHGCSVHWVTPELDSGPIIAQARVKVMPEDTAETLAARVLAEENRLYPKAVREILGTL
jgi:phosphoribosylglycinamide formyltransferase-1